MDFKFSKDAGDNPQQGAGDEKGKQNVLLVVLLILVAGFGYIYLFTDLIKPKQEQKVAEVPATPQVVKKPLPPSDGKPVKADVATAEVKKDVAPPAVKPEPVKAAPAPVVAAKPVTEAKPVVVAKPVVAEVAKPKVEAKKAESSQTVVKKPLPVAAKTGENKPVPVDKKHPVVAEKKPLPVKDGDKKVSDAKKPVEKSAAVAAAAVQPKKDVLKSAKNDPAVSADTADGRWTVLVGNYVLEEALVSDLARVRKAGLEAYVVPGTQKKNHMNRLMLAEFTDRAAAQVELDKLKRFTSDAFVIDSSGKHVVYAGSYLLDERAVSEKERLSAAGFKLTLKRADVAIPTKNLTAGSFAVKKDAEYVLNKLRAAGIKAALLH